MDNVKVISAEKIVNSTFSFQNGNSWNPYSKIKEVPEKNLEKNLPAEE